MNIARFRRVATTRPARPQLLLAALLSLLTLPLAPRDAAAQPPRVVARLVAEPARVAIQAGEAQPFKVTAYDAAGAVIPDAVVRVGGPRRALSFAGGEVAAFEAGSYTAIATASNPPGTPPVTLEIPVIVSWPALTRLTISAAPGTLVEGVMLAHIGAGLPRRRQRAPGPQGHVAQLGQ